MEIQDKTTNAVNHVPVVQNTQIVDVDVALQEWENYQELTEKLLVPKDYQKFPGGKFKKKSAWRKYGKAFRLSDSILEKEIIKDDKGRVKEASFVVKVTGPDGRFTTGFGNASKFERGFNKPNHDIPSTAHTRAKNRAISDYIGAGEVSAEEMAQGTIENEVNGKAMNHNKGKKPLSMNKPKDEHPSNIDPETIQDAEVTPKPETEQVDMTNGDRVDLAKLKGINDELDKWIEMTKDVGPTTRREVLETCQDLLGSGELEQKEFRAIKKAMGMKVK